MSFTAPEEDECFFVYTMVAESVLMLFPYPRDLWIATRADALPAKTRARLMRHYRSCNQRFLYARGRGKTLLSKNPGNAGRVRGLIEAFPDAHVVNIIRHPYESLPSHVSLFYVAWQVHSPEIAKVSPDVKDYADVAVDWYRNMFENRGRPDADHHVTIRYEDLVDDPQATVLGIYRHFGWRPDPAFEQRLAAAAASARGRRSAHRYSLEEYGLSPEWVQERLGEVMDAYALPR